MSKELLLVRHAKSDWNSGAETDFERPLNERGLKNAPDMASRLLSRGILPELLVSSPALRALSTAGLFADAFGIQRSDILRVPQIYEANLPDLLRAANEIDDQYDRVALFGHNPGISDFFSALAGRSGRIMPTCAVALISFPFDSWKHVSAGTGELLWYDYPKSRLQ